MDLSNASTVFLFLIAAPVGPMWSHILGFWEKRHEPNILFLKYEDMKKVLTLPRSTFTGHFRSHRTTKRINVIPFRISNRRCDILLVLLFASAGPARCHPPDGPVPRQAAVGGRRNEAGRLPQLQQHEEQPRRQPRGELDCPSTTQNCCSVASFLVRVYSPLTLVARAGGCSW